MCPVVPKDRRRISRKPEWFRAIFQVVRRYRKIVDKSRKKFFADYPADRRSH